MLAFTTNPTYANYVAMSPTSAGEIPEYVDVKNTEKSGFSKFLDNVGGALTGDNARDAADEQYRRQKELMEYSHQMQLDDQSTAYQRQLPDLLQAASATGVSPWLLLDSFSPQATSAQSGSVDKRDTLGFSDILRIFALILAGSRFSKATGAKVASSIDTKIPDFMVKRLLEDFDRRIAQDAPHILLH